MIFAVWPLVRLVFGNSFGENYWINLLFSLSILFLYYFVFETLFQRTPAKLVTSTRVVLENGSKPDIAVISLYTGKDPNHKGTWWHDRWTTTRVVKI